MQIFDTEAFQNQRPQAPGCSGRGSCTNAQPVASDCPTLVPAPAPLPGAGLPPPLEQVCPGPASGRSVSDSGEPGSSCSGGGWPPTSHAPLSLPGHRAGPLPLSPGPRGRWCQTCEGDEHLRAGGAAPQKAPRPGQPRVCTRYPAVPRRRPSPGSGIVQASHLNSSLGSDDCPIPAMLAAAILNS